jgi:hypothetical protein
LPEEKNSYRILDLATAVASRRRGSSANAHNAGVKALRFERALALYSQLANFASVDAATLPRKRS